MAHIGINVELAKEEHKRHLRRVRNKLLAEKDVEYMRALEAGDTDTQSRIVSEKQALRDCVNAVDDIECSCSCHDCCGFTAELKSHWPEDLLGPSPLGKYEGENIYVRPTEPTE